MTQRKPSQRYFRALALEPRILLDAAAVATAAEVAAQVDAPAADNAPGVQAAAVENVITLNEATSSFPAVDLFEQVRVTFGENQPAPEQLLIEVKGATANQALLIDGHEIALVAGSGATQQHGYEVAINGDTATITITIDPAAATATDLQELIDGIGYRPLNNDIASGNIEITLKGLRDGNGGTTDLSALTAQVSIVNRSDTALDTLQLARSSADASLFTASLLAVDEQQSQLGADTGDLDLSELIVSNDYPNPYTGMQGVVSVGDHVYAIRTTVEWVYNEETGTGGDVEISNLYIFQRSEDGTLSLVETLDANAQNGLAGAWDINVSSDGSTVSVSNGDGVVVMRRDADSGSLSTLARLGDAGMVTDALVVGERLYVTLGETLKVYERAADAWNEIDSEQASVEFSQFTAMQVSSDGKFLFVGVNGGTTPASAFSIAADGTLTQLPNSGITGEYFVTALALSADGKSLYALDNGKTLHTLAIASDGQLSISGAPIETGEGAKQIIASPDGNALIVAGEKRLELFTRTSTGAFALSQSYTGFDGASFGEIRSVSLSDDGTQLHLSGQFSWNDGLLVVDFKAASSSFTEGGEAVAVLPGGTLTDAQLDALGNGAGNYADASITVEREDGANSEDHFSFIDNGGLSLSGDQILLDGVAIASFTEANGSLTLTFIASVSRADAQKVLRGIAYSNSSDDPASRASLKMTFDNGDGQTSSRLVDMSLVGVNDPAIVDTTALTPTFNAEGERVPLFENTRIDTVEAGQTIWYVNVTFDSVRPGDVLGVGNGRIALDGPTGVGTTGTGQQYNIIRNADGSTSVWVYTTSRPVAEAEALIDSLTFGHNGSDVSGQRTITLSVREMANENETTTVADKAVVTIGAALSPNTPPSLDDVPASVPYTEQADPVVLAPGATLGDTQLDAHNGGLGNYDGATLVITLGDGKSAADSLGFLNGNGLSLDGNNLQKDGQTIGQLSVVDGVMTIRFSDANGTIPTTEDVQNTLRQVTYANSSDVPVASVAVSIELSDQRGLSVERTLAIAITAVNDAPVINDDPILSLGDLEDLQNLTDIPGLSTPTSSTVSADGSRVYVTDGQGNIALFSRDKVTGNLTHVQTFAGETGITQLQLTADGSALYALQQDGNSSIITGFAVDADGKLQQQSSLSGLWNIRAITLSDDGKNLYLINQTTVGVYSRDASSGALSHLGDLDASMTSEPYLWAPTEIVSRGNWVYVVTNPANGSTLIVYERGADGSLTAFANIHSGNSDATGMTVDLSNVQHIAVSNDGRTIFVANSRTSSYNGWTGETVIDNHPQKVDAFFLDTETGKLVHLGTLADTPTVEDIALSSDGKALFVTRSDGSLAYYSAITLEKMASSKEGLTGAEGLSVSADGAVIVTGSSLLVLRAPGVPGPSTETGGEPTLVFPALTLNDPELDAAGNYQGAKVTITGQTGDVFGFQGNGTYTLDGERILRDGVEVATLVQTGHTAVLSFTNALSQADATAVLRQITYASVSGDVGSHDITLVLNDGEADSAARVIVATLLAPNQPPEVGIDDYALSQAKAGQAYSITLPAGLITDPEGQSLTWKASGLPAGLRFDPATRTISGTTTVMGEHRIVVTATDPKGASVALELTLSVENSAPVVGADYSLGKATIEQSYSVTLPQNLFSDANDANLSWTLELPEWLSYDPATRTLSGTAPQQAGSFTVVVTATDPHGAAVSRTLTLVVELPPHTTVPQQDNGVRYQATTGFASAFAGPALDAPLFEPGDTQQQGTGEDGTPAALQQSLLRSDSGSGLADGRASLSEQLLNADRVLTDSGYQDARGSFSFDGTTLRSTVDLNQNSGGRSIALHLPADAGSAQRVTLANGLPLPSWASFDARSGELRIDRERLQRDGVLRLTLISRDDDGREQRTPVEVRAEQVPANAEREAPQASAAQIESLPERLQQETSSALLSDALELLDQLSDLAGEPVAITTRHTA